MIFYPQSLRSPKQFYEYIIMQELFDILAHKFRLINNDPTNLSNKEKDKLLDELLIQKKKESLRILVETRLQQTLDSKRVTGAEQLLIVLQKTHKTMIIYDSQLPLPLRDDPITSIVDLYVDFFTRQNCKHRAQEISNIHKKKLCPKGLLTTTFFNWLVEWTRKQFQEYLKTAIHSLYVDSRQAKPHNSHNRAETERQQLETDLNQLIVKKHLPISINRCALSSSLREKRSVLLMELQQKKAEKKEDPRLKSHSPSEKIFKLDQAETIEVEDNFPINKQIFYSAYAEEIQSFYKTIEICVPDLDLAFAKRFRKGGRKAQLKRRVRQVASNMIKHMVHIKQSIDSYHKYYWSVHEIIKKKSKNKKERKSTLERLDNSDIPSKTSHGIRSISTEKFIDERRKNLIYSFSKSQRYALEDKQRKSRSNLLPNSDQSEPSKVKNQAQIRSKSIELSFSSPRNQQQSKFLVLNSGYISAELEIIQQKAQKIKAKANKNAKKSTHKKHSKSIHEEQTMDVAYSSLPVTIDITPASHIRLPKIRRLK